MRANFNKTYSRISSLFFAFVIAGVFVFQVQATTLSPQLSSQLNTLGDNANVGMVIVSFNTNDGLQQSHLNVLRSVGVTGGQTFSTLGSKFIKFNQLFTTGG